MKNSIRWTLAGAVLFALSTSVVYAQPIYFDTFSTYCPPATVCTENLGDGRLLTRAAEGQHYGGTPSDATQFEFGSPARINPARVLFVLSDVSYMDWKFSSFTTLNDLFVQAGTTDDWTLKIEKGVLEGGTSEAYCGGTDQPDCFTARIYKGLGTSEYENYVAALELGASPPQPVPEPSTLVLLGIGILGIGAVRKLKKR